MTAASFLSKLGFTQPAAERPAPAPQMPAAAPAPAPQPVVHQEGAQFDRMGRLGEKVGEQMAYLASRLNEMQSLRDDFASIVHPISDFVRTHEEAQTRVLELEALLGKERDDLKELRRDLSEERNLSARVRGDLAAALKQLGSLEEAASSTDERIRTLQEGVDEHRSNAAYLAQQLAAQSDRNEALTLLTDTHSAALAIAEQKLAAEQARASDLADSKETIAVELARLQETVEQLSPELLAARRRIAELQAQVNDASMVIGSLESKLATERDLRSSLEQTRAQESAAWDNERGTLTRQLESIGTRHTTTTRLLEQARQFGRDKSEEVLRAEKLAKEAQEAKAAAERRLTLLQDEARHSKAEFTAAEGKLREVAQRCDMLERAMTAKDAQVEQANSRAAALSEQIASTTARFEQEHATLEAANRKLIEQLQNEKAERALVQGALSIARSSREKLLDQISALKKNRGNFNPSLPASAGMPDERNAAESAPQGGEEESNVRMLKASER
jgi:crescentin